MRKLLITAFFVALMATPVAAQPVAPAMAPAMRPVTMAPAAMVAPRPVAMRAAPARPMARPVVMRAAPVAMAPSMAPAAPVAAMSVPATMAVPAAMVPEQPTMAAAPTKAASAAKKDSKGSVVGGWLLQLVLGILGIALPIILTPLVIWLLKKMKVEDAKVHQMVDDMVDKAVGVGIHYAEEQAHKLKDNPVDGAKKLAMAGEKAQAYLKDSGIVDKGSNYIKGLIEAKLGEKRSNEVAKPEEKEEDKEEKKPDDK